LLEIAVNSTPPNEITWLPAGHPDNPFPYEVLDCRAVALNYMSTTSDPNTAANFVGLRRNDGRSLRGRTPEGAVTVAGEVRLPGRYTLDGPVFIAPEMEHKWDLFAYDSRLYARRSWTGDLIHTAVITTLSDELVLNGIESNVDSALNQIEVLMTWYVARRPFPFAIPPEFLEMKDADFPTGEGIENLEMLIALWGWSAYGRVAQFARRT
jgi:hypothetical protein